MAYAPASESMIFNFRPSEEQNWTRQSVCATEGGDIMFPPEYDAARVEAARALCSRCPVIDECLQAALKRGESFGMWGGLTTDERRAMRRAGARRVKP